MSFIMSFLNHFSGINPPVSEFPSAKNQTKISNKRSYSMLSLSPELWHHLNCSQMHTKGLSK
jgi:hypothetical protein